MSRENRDPFPMQSEEAKRLAGSDDDGLTKGWNRMEASSGLNTSMEGRKDEDAVSSSSSLLSSSKKKKKKLKEEDDIYSHAEEEEFRARRYEGEEENERRGILERVVKKLYGDNLSLDQLLQTLCLSSCLFFLIGGYWLLRSLKDPVLIALCGVTTIPKAKMLSVLVVLVVVSLYNSLLDRFSSQRHLLFYIFGSFYFALFSIISFRLDSELRNETPDPSRLIGWVSYCAIESFGSVMVSLFWSFANSHFSLKQAEASYGLLVAAAQIGSILGPSVVQLRAATWGVPRCYFVGALCMIFLQACFYLYTSIYGLDSSSAHQSSSSSKKPKAGILEGIYLFVEHNYVKGIFAISCLFMVEVTIVDYFMKVLAQVHFAKLHPCTEGSSCWASGGMSEDATKAFTTFMGLFGQATNSLSFLLSFFGTSAVLRYFGFQLTLLLFPILCLAVIIMVWMRPTLYVVFAAMMILKANTYAFNNPTKEILYQPTSMSIKFKAKSWIEIFGARGSKALGSIVTNAFATSSSEVLIHNGSLVGTIIAIFLIWNARYMGRTFDEYMASGYIVGHDENDDVVNIQMASHQNEGEDTSCAIPDEDDNANKPQLATV